MCELIVNIPSKEKTYPIYINNNDISSLKSSILNYIGEKNYIVVINEKVHKLYPELDFPKNKTVVIKDGEQEKNIKNFLKILDFCFKNQLTRQDCIIAIGGGVIGDIAGFVSSVYMRGINLIQVPTTLLSCTDSSVGGKTAINSKYGKNLIGAFYQPKAVFINVNFLKTLDEKQFQSGLGEVLKYGFIEKSCLAQEDYNLMNFLRENQEKIISKDVLILMDLIKICLNLKISVVQNDEKESGLRKILNYGHTYGHALETITGYKKYTHGQCVAAGIYFALNLAFETDKIDKEYKFLCEDILHNFGFEPITKYNMLKLIDIMRKDKKATTDEIKFILPCDYAKVSECSFPPMALDILK